MITIIHGDDIAKSREKFIADKNNSASQASFDKDLSLLDLIQITEGGSLFTEYKDIFIENFLSNKKTSSEFKDIVTHIEEKSKKFNFVFWENKQLEKSTLSIFKNATAQLFNLPQSLFSFLDQIKPNCLDNLLHFHLALKNSSEDIIFYMLIRQFRLLIAVSDNNSRSIDEVKRLAPWQRSKLEKQAKLFDKDHLLFVYNQLYDIDIAQKSGTLGKSLIQAIDFLLSKI